MCRHDDRKTHWFSSKSFAPSIVYVRSRLMPGDGMWKDFVIPASFWHFIDADWEDPAPFFIFVSIKIFG